MTDYTKDHERLTQKLEANKKVAGECWIWTGPVRHTPKTGSGPRGVITIGGWMRNNTQPGKKEWGQRPRKYIVHRASYVLHKGEIPVGMEVCHSCDNSLCYRPEHLFLGTHKDNMLDCSEKGRIRNGAKKGQPLFKLTTAQACAIRQRRNDGESGFKLAVEFGVHYSTVYKIANGRRRAKDTSC